MLIGSSMINSEMLSFDKNLAIVDVEYFDTTKIKSGSFDPIKGIVRGDTMNREKYQIFIE